MATLDRIRAALWAVTRPYGKVWTGGTFDHLHDGHKELMARAFEAGDFVLVGITADEVVQGKAHAELIQTVEERQAALEAHLAETYGRDRFEVVVQGSVYTEASLDPDLEANVLCYKTKQHFDDINERREARGLRPLEWVMSASECRHISSTKIRERLARERG